MSPFFLDFMFKKLYLHPRHFGIKDLENNFSLRFYKNSFMLSIFLLNFFYQCVLSESYFMKSAYFRELQDCMDRPMYKDCKTIILQTEKMQIEEYNKGNFKCQTSLLGIQTELVNKVYFENNRKSLKSLSIKNVIKNC